MRHSAAQRLGYGRDLLSPAELTLLKHAQVIELDEAPESSIVAFELAELPD